MYRTLLVPLDGSLFAEDALPMGRLLARILGAELHLAHVIRPAPDTVEKTPQDDFEWREKAREWGESYLAPLAAESRGEGVSVFTAVLEGPVVESLDRYSEEQGIDLVVLTSHGEGGVHRWWLGSVADRLLGISGKEILLVRSWDDTAERPRALSRFDRIMVPVDGSRHAEAALDRARDLASRFGSLIDALMVLPRPVNLSSIRGVRGVELAGPRHERRLAEAKEYLRGLVGRFDPDTIDGNVIESGSPAEGIIDAARQQGADLIVLSSHGRGGLSRAVLGSVADKVVRGASQPVLVVRAVG